MKRRLLTLGLALGAALIALPGSLGSPSARAATSAAAACDLDYCSRIGFGAYVSCVNDRRPAPGGWYDEHTGIRDCPMEGEVAEATCQFTTGCYD